MYVFLTVCQFLVGRGNFSVVSYKSSHVSKVTKCIIAKNNLMYIILFLEKPH